MANKRVLIERYKMKTFCTYLRSSKSIKLVETIKTNQQISSKLRKLANFLSENTTSRICETTSKSMSRAVTYTQHPRHFVISHMVICIHWQCLCITRRTYTQIFSQSYKFRPIVRATVLTKYQSSLTESSNGYITSKSMVTLMIAILHKSFLMWQFGNTVFLT